MAGTDPTYRFISNAGTGGAVPATSQRTVARSSERARAVIVSHVVIPLFKPGLGLHASAVLVPLQLRIPSLHVNSAILGVGLTASNVMDAPMGPPNDPVWQQAFWYRGGGIPGEVGTATIAAHVHGGSGPPLFAHLADLREGDMIEIHDSRNGADIRFVVSSTMTYSLKEAREKPVLAQIYGSGPVSGQGPQPSSDGVSHLTLITCAGEFVGHTFDHRLVVYAERTDASGWETSRTLFD